jgi:glycosyltransferase involved in cell wall biosynthesis
MRICLDYRSALSAGTGVGTYVRNLLSALACAYPNDTLTAFCASWRDRAPTSLASENVVVADRRIPVRALDRLWHRWNWPPVEYFVGPQDIAHSPYPMLLPARSAHQVISVHDCYFLRAPEDVYGTVLRDYVPLARASAQCADAILVPSESTAAEAIELLGADREKIHVIPLGVDPLFLDPAERDAQVAQQIRKQYELSAPYLLFVGRREARKNLGALLQAMAEIVAGGDDVSLVIAGPDAPGWEDVWAAAPEAARQRTRLLPHVPIDELLYLYADASALVMPSLWEGFGFPALEAMAMGTPVVASRAGSLPEVLGDAALWADPEDPGTLVDACRLLLREEATTLEYGQRGLLQARLYPWKKTADLTRSVYQQLVSR